MPLQEPFTISQPIIKYRRCTIKIKHRLKKQSEYIKTFVINMKAIQQRAFLEASKSFVEMPLQATNTKHSPAKHISSEDENKIQAKILGDNQII